MTGCPGTTRQPCFPRQRRSDWEESGPPTGSQEGFTAIRTLAGRTPTTTTWKRAGALRAGAIGSGTSKRPTTGKKSSTRPLRVAACTASGRRFALLLTIFPRPKRLWRSTARPLGIRVSAEVDTIYLCWTACTTKTSLPVAVVTAYGNFPLEQAAPVRPWRSNAIKQISRS